MRILVEMIDNKTYGKNAEGTEFRYTFDMYRVGDRLLDTVLCDVIWDLTTNPVSIKAVEIHPKYDNYMAKLNKEYWIEQVKLVVQDDLDSIIGHEEDIEVIMAYTNNDYAWLDY